MYKWYISGIYCQLGDYMPPTTFYGNQKQPLKHAYIPKKSPTVGPTERTPKKPEYLIARSQLTELGPLVRSHSIFDGYMPYPHGNDHISHQTGKGKLSSKYMSVPIGGYLPIYLPTYILGYIHLSISTSQLSFYVVPQHK